MESIEVLRIERDSSYWKKLIEFAENCSWEAGKHLADIMRNNEFKEWESVFAALANSEIVGFCTFLKTDYYPENRYSPWISTIFVSESFRGRRVSQKMIESVMKYAKKVGFSKVFIPSDIIGLYEKYGFVKIDELLNYGGDVDNIFAKEI